MKTLALVPLVLATLLALAGCGDTTVTDLDGKGKLITTKLTGGGTLVTTCNADGVCTKELIRAPVAAPPPAVAAPIAAAVAPGWRDITPPRAPSGIVDAGHRRLHAPTNPCLHGGTWDTQTRSCLGTPRAKWRPQPWADAEPYDNGPTDSGWIHPRGRCLSYPNC